MTYMNTVYCLWNLKDITGELGSSGDLKRCFSRKNGLCTTVVVDSWIWVINYTSMLPWSLSP